MSADQTRPLPDKRPGVDILGSVIALLAFLAGIGMIVMVFFLTYRLFTNIDEEIGRVQTVAPRPAPHPQPPAPNPQPGTKTPAPPPTPADAPKIAQPHGPSVVQVAAVLALKILALLLLALCGSLVAAKGAQLAGAYRGKST
jgi:hypothetical protein